MRLALVCDTSGSMGEGGKAFIMRTTVMAVAQTVRLGNLHAEIRLCGWASKARHFLEWRTNDEFPKELFSCGGNSNGKALIHLLGEIPEGKVLLLSDGNWERTEARVLKHWEEGLHPDTLRVIKIGVDANPDLKGHNVFTVEDLFLALAGWQKEGLA